MLLTLLLLLSPLAEAKRLPVKPQITQDCTDALKKVTQYSSGLNATCTKNEDCGIFYASPDACAKPLVLRKDAHVTDDKNLRELQEKAKKACESSWSHRPACEPLGAMPECRGGKCVDAT